MRGHTMMNLHLWHGLPSIQVALLALLPDCRYSYM